MDCLFCKLAQQSDSLVWQGERVAAFRDIHPKAPVHVLVVPKRHVATLHDLADATLAAELVMAVRQVAEQEGIVEGYRVVINVGRGGGQVVDHLHLHVMGGKQFSHDEIQASAQ